MPAPVDPVKAEAERQAAADREARRKEAETQKAVDAEKFAWLATAREQCTQFRAAPNEIKKNELLKAHKKFLAGVTLTDVRGVLKKLEKLPYRQGEVYKIVLEVVGQQFQTVDDYDYGNEAIQYGLQIGELVTPGSRLYKQVSALREGQCVRFSTGRGLLRTTSILTGDEEKVCGTLFVIANLKSVQPCE
jgi:predicted DNA-binding antitoxin AbrB/MazE fold protein